MASSDPPTTPPTETDWGALAEDASTIGPVRVHFEETGVAADRWLLEGSPADVKDMTDLLEDVAVGLGYAEGPQAWVDALETLRRESSSFKYGGTVTIFDNVGESGEGRYGTIDNLNDAVARFCRKLRRKSEQIARLTEVQARAAEPERTPDTTKGLPTPTPDLETKQGRIAAVNACRAAWAAAEERLHLPPGNWVWKAADYANRTAYHDWINTGKNSARFRFVLGLPAEEVIKRVRAWHPKSK